MNFEQDEYGVYGEVVEFPEEYEQTPTRDETIRALARGMKDWAKVLSSDVESWRKGRESEVPYLLKILVSSEEELVECLSYSK